MLSITEAFFPSQSNLTHWERARRITQDQNHTKTDATSEASVKTDVKKFSIMFLNLGLAHSILSPHNLLPCWSLSQFGIFPGDIRDQDQGKTCPAVVLAGLLSASSLSSNHITELTLQLFPQLCYKSLSLSSLQTHSYKTSRNSTPLRSLSTCQILLSWPATSEVFKMC